jgi:hypothetical protein
MDSSVTRFNIPPYNPSGWQIVGKTMIGLVLWILTGFMIFLIVILVSGALQEAIRGRVSDSLATINPLLSLILLLIAFVSTFIGNTLNTLTYNIFFGSKYYDAGKTFSFVIISNVILLFFFSPLYMMFSDNIQSMFVILGIHVLVAIFVSASIQEFVTNPHYSGSHLIGALLGLSVTIFAFGLVIKSVDLNTSGIEKILLSMPAFLWYLIMPLFQSIWEKTYYKFYELGNNFMYIPSLEEVIAASQAEVWENEDQDDPDTQINVDL